MQKALWVFIVVLVQAAIAQDCARIVPVNVFSSETSQPIAFPPERLHASVGKRPLGISNFEKIKGNRILLLIDISGSMGDKSLREVLDLLLEQGPPDSSLAYGFFSTKIFLSKGFGNFNEVKKAIQQLPPLEVKGHTALYDALDQALKLFQQPVPGDSILLITDGGENASKALEKTIRKELMESGVRVFAIVPVSLPVFLPAEGSPSPPPAPSLVMQMTAPISVLTEKTGGTIYLLMLDDARWSVKKWRAPILQSIQKFWIEGVGGGYRATVRLPANLTKPGGLRLQLDKKGDNALWDGVVTYPEYLLPCPSAAPAH